jgi:hypothetical protein
MPFTAKVITTAEWHAKPPLNGFQLRTPKYVIVHHTADQNPPQQSVAGHPRRRDQARATDPERSLRAGMVGLRAQLPEYDGRLRPRRAHRHGRRRAARQVRAIGSCRAGPRPPGQWQRFARDRERRQLHDLRHGRGPVGQPRRSLCDACNVSPDNIRGYREFSSTQCPGDWLFGQLPRLRQEVAAKLGHAPAGAPAAGTPTAPASFKFGDAGPLVMTIQMLLAGKGHSAGAIDGIFGENTRAAVVAFQNDVGISPPDGAVDPRTRTALGLY